MKKKSLLYVLFAVLTVVFVSCSRNKAVSQTPAEFIPAAPDYTGNEELIQSRARLAMEDVCAAFDQFESQRDKKRPLIIAGFSQGGACSRDFGGGLHCDSRFGKGGRHHPEQNV